MTNYITLLSEALPGITPEDIDLPFNETGIHSLDSIILRGTIESHFGFGIPDDEWYRSNSLSETLAYCSNRKNSSCKLIFSESTINATRRQEIKIPQMANSALSENWLLKEMGDMHWEMLAKGLEQRSSEFTDNLGNRLYAAFVRANYLVSPLNQFGENETLQLDAKIKKLGTYAYYSCVEGQCGGQSVQANLMTSFSARKTKGNEQMCKTAPEERVNHIEELEAVPEFYIEHRLVKKSMTDKIYSGSHCFNLTDNVIESINHTIHPYYEINGVGLLYFAAYPLIADECTSAFMKNTMEIKDFDAAWTTTYRDIFYFANCNADDRIRVDLNNIEHIGKDRIQTTTSMYREHDNKLMAKILTIKEKKAQ